MQHGAFRIALIYIIISLLWITFSDRLLFYFAAHFTQNEFLLISSGKGYLFVVANGLLLYYLINRDDKKLLQSETQYRNMYEANPIPMWIYDENLNIISVNDAAISTYGYTRDEFLTKNIVDIRPAEDAEKVIRAAREMPSTLNLSGKWRHIKKDGAIMQVSITSHKITFNNRPNVLVMIRDMTEQAQFEQEKNKHLSNLEITLNSISDAFFALDYDMRIVRINQAFRDIIEERFTKIVGESVFTLFPREKNRLFPYYEKALRERVIVRTDEYSLVLNKWIRLAAYPTDEGVSVYFSDITENKLKDIKLQETLERYELLTEATKDVIYDLNIPANSIAYNTSLTQLINVGNEQIAHTLDWWRNLIHPDDVEDVISSQQRVKDEGKTNWTCEYRVNSGDNVYKYIMDQGYFIYNEQKQPLRLIGVIKDIDDLKQSIQENKRQNEFLKEIAWLSSHEIRRPVATMLGLAYLMDMAETDEEKQEIFDLLKISMNEMDSIVHIIHGKINDVVNLT
jgi:PAS domain S-box-containing protein